MNSSSVSGIGLLLKIGQYLVKFRWISRITVYRSFGTTENWNWVKPHQLLENNSAIGVCHHELGLETFLSWRTWTQNYWEQVAYECTMDQELADAAVHAPGGSTFQFVWNDDVTSDIRLRQSIYLKYIPAKFHPDLLWNNAALSASFEGRPNKNNNNKMSSDRRISSWSTNFGRKLFVSRHYCCCCALTTLRPKSITPVSP